jgi:hypothetical protein
LFVAPIQFADEILVEAAVDVEWSLRGETTEPIRAPEPVVDDAASQIAILPDEFIFA